VQPVPMHRRLFGGEIVPNIQPELHRNHLALYWEKLLE